MTGDETHKDSVFGLGYNLLIMFGINVFSCVV
jgi:hypothetical protein